MTRVADKIAIVTGGSSGIGRGCAIRLAEEGARVAITDIDPEMGAQTVNLIEGAGGTARFFEHDVTQEEAWERVTEEVEAQLRDLEAENARIAEALEAEEKDLTQKRASMTPEEFRVAAENKVGQGPTSDPNSPRMAKDPWG